jgi:hypothetical protein
MVAYCERLIASELHKARDYIYRLLAVTVRKIVLDGVVRHALPYAVLLYVSHLCLIEVSLANVVQKRGDGKRLLGKLKAVLLAEARILHLIAKAFVYVKAMLEQTSLVRAVKSRRRGRREEIGLLAKIVEKLVCSLSLNAGVIYFNKFFSVIHIHLK